MKLFNVDTDKLIDPERYMSLDETNSQGYRCAEWSEIDWESSYAMIGCSHIFGTGNRLKNTLPAQLEHLIGKPCINLGVPGANYLHSFINASELLHHTAVEKVIIVFSYPERKIVFKEKGVYLESAVITRVLDEHALNFYKTSALQKFLSSVYDAEHFEVINSCFERILLNHYSSRLLLLNIVQLEQQFGGVTRPDINYDLALDKLHYGPKWNQKAAQYIKDRLDD